MATINLLTLSVTYNPFLPVIKNTYTSVFISATDYYIPAYHETFNIDYTNLVLLNANAKQGIVYSS
jgi:hypothetical protein